MRFIPALKGATEQMNPNLQEQKEGSPYMYFEGCVIAGVVFGWEWLISRMQI
jgi:hypothetical protein